MGHSGEIFMRLNEGRGKYGNDKNKHVGKWIQTDGCTDIGTYTEICARIYMDTRTDTHTHILNNASVYRILHIPML